MIVMAMMCPICGHWQGRSIIHPNTYVFKCDHCKKTRKLMYENKIGFQVNYQRFLNLKEAIGYAIDKNGENKNKEGTFRTANQLQE